MISFNDVPIQDDSLTARRIGEETVIVSSDGEVLHSMNDVATFIWGLLDGNTPLSSIAARVCEEYEVSREVAEKDLRSFVDELLEKGLVHVGT